MRVFKRTFFSMIKGIVIAPVTGVLVYFIVGIFLGDGLLLRGIALGITMILLYLALFSEHIRFEVENGIMRYYQKGRLMNTFTIKNCGIRCRVKSETSFPPTHDIDLYIIDGENDPDSEIHIDCTPLGFNQFHRMYALLEQEVPVTKLETTKKEVG